MNANMQQFFASFVTNFGQAELQDACAQLAILPSIDGKLIRSYGAHIGQEEVDEVTRKELRNEFKRYVRSLSSNVPQVSGSPKDEYVLLFAGAIHFISSLAKKGNQEAINFLVDTAAHKSKIQREIAAKDLTIQSQQEKIEQLNEFVLDVHQQVSSKKFASLELTLDAVVDLVEANLVVAESQPAVVPADSAA
jgi:hypothetical protein